MVKYLLDKFEGWDLGTPDKLIGTHFRVTEDSAVFDDEAN